jgi:uncharacterized membrane protein
MLEHQTAIMIVAFGVWGLIFVVFPLTTFILNKRRPR